MFVDCGRGAALPLPTQRDVAQYHAINNVGTALEFLARMSSGTTRPIGTSALTPLSSGPDVLGLSPCGHPFCIEPEPIVLMAPLGCAAPLGHPRSDQAYGAPGAC
jgi:hypothetical protein